MNSDEENKQPPVIKGSQNYVGSVINDISQQLTIESTESDANE